MNIFFRSFSIVGTFIDSSNSRNNCTKNSGSVPKGRLRDERDKEILDHSLLVQLVLLDVDEWVHMQSVFEEHVKKLFGICRERHTTSQYIQTSRLYNRPFSSVLTPFIFPNCSSLFLNCITDSNFTTPYLRASFDYSATSNQQRYTYFLRGLTMPFHNMSPISVWIGATAVGDCREVCVMLFRLTKNRESKTSLRAKRPNMVASR